MRAAHRSMNPARSAPTRLALRSDTPLALTRYATACHDRSTMRLFSVATDRSGKRRPHVPMPVSQRTHGNPVAACRPLRRKVRRLCAG